MPSVFLTIDGLIWWYMWFLHLIVANLLGEDEGELREGKERKEASSSSRGAPSRDSYQGLLLPEYECLT